MRAPPKPTRDILVIIYLSRVSSGGGGLGLGMVRERWGGGFRGISLAKVRIFENSKRLEITWFRCQGILGFKYS